jgi:hypothetical protein
MSTATFDRRDPQQPHDDGDVEQGRPIPFTIRVAALWTSIEQAPSEEDGQLLFSRRANLTGSPSTTNMNRDVAFSDLEL